MKKLCLLTLFLPIMALAQSRAETSVRLADTAFTGTRTVTVTGIAKETAVPDMVRLHLTMKTEHANASQAWSDSTQTAASAIARFKELGIEAADIATTSINIYPGYDYQSNGTRGPLLYRVHNSLSVAIRDLGSLGNVLETITALITEENRAEISFNMSMDVSDKAEAYSGALASAMSDARAKAQILANAESASLGQVLKISTQWGGVPVDSGQESLANDSYVAPGQQEIGTSVSVTFALQ